LPAGEDGSKREHDFLARRRPKVQKRDLSAQRNRETLAESATPSRASFCVWRFPCAGRAEKWRPASGRYLLWPAPPTASCFAKETSGSQKPSRARQQLPRIGVLE